MTVNELLHAHARGMPLGKENETKEKGTGNPATFPFETRYLAAIGPLRTVLKWAGLFLAVLLPYVT